MALWAGSWRGLVSLLETLCPAALMLLTSSAQAGGGSQVIAAEDFELQLAPDLRLSLDREFLDLRY